MQERVNPFLFFKYFLVQCYHAVASFSFIATAEKMKFAIKYFFGKCDQVSTFLRIWKLLLKNILDEKVYFLRSVS